MGVVRTWGSKKNSFAIFSSKSSKSIFVRCEQVFYSKKIKWECVLCMTQKIPSNINPPNFGFKEIASVLIPIIVVTFNKNIFYIKSSA